MNDAQEEGHRNRLRFILSALYQRTPMSVRVLGDKLSAFASITDLPLALPKTIREDGTWSSLAAKTAQSAHPLVELKGEGKNRQASLSDEATNPRGEAMSEAELAARQPALALAGDGAQHSRAEVRSMLMNSPALSGLEEIEKFVVGDVVCDWLVRQPGMEVHNEYGNEVFSLSSPLVSAESTGVSTVVAGTNVAGEATAEAQRAVPQVDTPEPSIVPAADSEPARPSSDKPATQQPVDVLDDTAREGEAPVGIEGAEQEGGGEEKTGSADATVRQEPPLVVAGVKVHPVALIFPRPAPEQYAALKKDIEKNEQLVRIPTVDGEAIDGLSRLTACEELGKKPLLEELNPRPASLTAYVLGLNLNRRHLTASQKATIAVEAEHLLAKEAEARERAGKSADGEAGGRGRKNPTQKVGEGKHAGEAAEQAAKLTGSNREYIRTAKQIQEENPKLFKDVQEGNTTLQEAKKKIVKTTKGKRLIAKTTTGKATTVKGEFDDSVFKPLIKDLTEKLNARGKAVGKGRSFDRCAKAMKGFEAALKKWQSERDERKKPRTVPK